MLRDLAEILWWIFVAMVMIIGIVAIIFVTVLFVTFVWFLWKERNGSESDS